MTTSPVFAVIFKKLRIYRNLFKWWTWQGNDRSEAALRPSSVPTSPPQFVVETSFSTFRNGTLTHHLLQSVLQVWGCVQRHAYSQKEHNNYENCLERHLAQMFKSEKRWSKRRGNSESSDCHCSPVEDCRRVDDNEADENLACKIIHKRQKETKQVSTLRSSQLQAWTSTGKPWSSKVKLPVIGMDHTTVDWKHDCPLPLLSAEHSEYSATLIATNLSKGKIRSAKYAQYCECHDCRERERERALLRYWQWQCTNMQWQMTLQLHRGMHSTCKRS